MPEAPPDRPGHVGHTPQDVAGILSRARAAAIPTSPAAMAMPTEYAAQTFPAIGTSAGEVNAASTLIQIDRAAARRGRRQPWPSDFLKGPIRD